MPNIIRAEYLSHQDANRNSDKLFNVFLISNDDGSYSCLTENGRRGSKLVLRTICEKVGREAAEQTLRQKLSEKRNHASTPYRNEINGTFYSQIIRNGDFRQSASDAMPLSQPPDNPMPEIANALKSNVIEFPLERIQKRSTAQPGGILNSGQFDSLEI